VLAMFETLAIFGVSWKICTDRQTTSFIMIESQYRQEFCYAEMEFHTMLENIHIVIHQLERLTNP
jgi:hypothetical protein